MLTFEKEYYKRMTFAKLLLNGRDGWEDAVQDIYLLKPLATFEEFIKLLKTRFCYLFVICLFPVNAGACYLFCYPFLFNALRMC